jgi:serine/threonine protein kinase
VPESFTVYTAPELLLGLPHTSKVSVYSFAIIAWQLASAGVVPFRDYTTSSNQVESMVVSEGFWPMVVDGLRPTIDQSWPEDFVALLCSCWHSDPSKRPTFGVILDRLQRIRAATGYRHKQSTCTACIGARGEEEKLERLGKRCESGALYEKRHPENGPRGMPSIDLPRPSTSYEGRSMWF